MFEGFEQQVISLMQTIYDRFGWLGVAALMIFENATGVLPSEIILGLAGWMLLSAHNAPWYSILFGGLYAALGGALGASVTYWFARLGGRPLVDRAAGWFRIDPRFIHLAEHEFRRKGPGIVLFGRILPGVRVLVSIPAGLARMPFTLFFLYTFLGAYLWCTVLIALGYWIGHEWGLISSIFKQLTPFVILALVVLAGMGLVARQFILRRLRPHPTLISADPPPVQRDKSP